MERRPLGVSSRADRNGLLLVNALNRAYAFVARIAPPGDRFVSWADNKLRAGTREKTARTWQPTFHATETGADRAMLGNCRRRPDNSQGSSSDGESGIPMILQQGLRELERRFASRGA